MEMSLCDELTEIMYDADLELREALPLGLFQNAPEALVDLCHEQEPEELCSLFALPELAEGVSTSLLPDIIIGSRSGLLLTFHLGIPEDIAFDADGEVESYGTGCCSWVIRVYADTMTDGVALALREAGKLLDGAFDRARKEQGA
ncbi:hypothetical protein RVX_R27010 [Nitratidesulfovibrio sp. HK-II]|uniref:hypothetical protein n=1 Tax=Nitratidesulfovibrio sp. HK-II TaxID=2009266 RepID=UPI003A5FCC96